MTKKCGDRGQWLALVTVLACTACGGAAAEAGPTTAPVAIDESVRALGFAVHVDGSGVSAVDHAIAEQLRNELVRAGTRVAAGSANQGAHRFREGQLVEDGDVRLQVSVTLSERTQFIRFVKNGRSSKSYDARVTAVLEAGGTILDQNTITVQTDDDGSLDGQVGSSLVSPLLGSMRLATYAKQRAESRRRDEERMQAAHEAADESAWAAAEASQCAEPRTPSACAGVEAYLAGHPHGEHVAEAKALLDGSKPKLARMQGDHAAWREANPMNCRRYSQCDGVRAYLDEYPEGLHAAHANETLQEAKMQVKAAQDAERREVAAERAEAQRQRTAQQKAGEQKAAADKRDACYANCLQTCATSPDVATCKSTCPVVCK